MKARPTLLAACVVFASLNAHAQSSKAPAKSQVNGKTYYFCSSGCKDKFDANPKQYAQ